MGRTSLDTDTASGLVGSLSDAQTFGADGNRITSIVTASPGRSRHIFEALGTGGKATFEYTVTITYPIRYGVAGPAIATSRTHVLDLDLRPIEEFYTRRDVPYITSSGQDLRFAAHSPSDYGMPHFPDVGPPRNTATTAESFFIGGPETTVLVHGWNMTDGTNGNATDWKKAFAETAFKRLYWQGFRGNFESFDWPTFSDSEGPVQGGPLLESSNFSYNASEFQAFRSGQALKNLLAGLRADGPVHLLAHSMGNVVAAEALRQWAANQGNGPLVTSYVAMQGALSAGAYGDDSVDAIPAPGSTTDLYLNWPTGVEGAGSRFYMEGTAGAAASWINMYNPVDAATSGQLTGWGKNNSLKPFAGNTWRDMLFASSEITAPRFTYYIDSEGRYVRSYATELGLPIDEGVVDLTPRLIGPDSQPRPSAYEIIAFMAKANSMPIGTKEVDFFGNNNFDINGLGLPELYQDQWSGHSFQFHFDAAMTAPFWKKVVEASGMGTVA